MNSGKGFDKMVFIDTNVFIAYLEEGDLFQKDAEKFFLKLEGASLVATASSVSLMELVYVLKKHKKTNKEISKIIHLIFSIENLKFLPITADLIKEASDFIESYNLGLSDAIVIATLSRLSISDIVSEDSDFDKVPFIKRLHIRDII